MAGGGALPDDAGVDSGSVEPTPTSLAFVPATALTLAPKQTHELTLQATPAGSYQVRFALLGSDGAPGDAALDTSEVQSDPDGVARAMLTAPSIPTRFSVRASVGTVQTQLGVAVSQRGYTTLRVDPSYSGSRAVVEWTATASAKPGATCSKLVGNPPADGDLSVTAAPGKALTLQHVPVGSPLVITLRAGHYIGGCADQSALSEGDRNQVLVYASDRPVNLAATELDLSFGPSDRRADFDELMKRAANLAESVLPGSDDNDVSALLDDMQVATASEDRNAFSTARATYGWDTALGRAFGKSADRRMRDPAQRWLLSGLSSFDAADAFFGQLKAVGGAASFTLTRVAALEPASAGFPSSFQSSWSADSSDTLLLGSELSWVPSRLVTALAIAPAVLEFPTATDVETALAQSVDCALVARVLLSASSSPYNAIYAGCDQVCAENACSAAVASAWERARNASGSDGAALSVTASGAVEVGDTAEVTRLNGTWLGQLVVGVDAASASGSVSAVPSAQAAP